MLSSLSILCPRVFFWPCGCQELCFANAGDAVRVVDEMADIRISVFEVRLH
jgi:hypothetical protein